MTRYMTIGDVKALCEKLAKPHGFTVRDATSDEMDDEEPGVVIVFDDIYAVIEWDDGYWVHSIIYSEYTHSIPKGHADAERVVQWAIEGLLEEKAEKST